MTFKVESHNHPSYVEPYQGAATGVGGIVRDIMSMGARPVAVMDPLRFGAGRRRGHAAGAARRRGGHRRLRQLPRPAEHRRRGGLRPVVRRQPARQRAVRRRDAPRGHQAGVRVRQRQPGRAVRRRDRRRRHRRRVGARVGDVRGRAVRRSGPACRSATRSWRRCSSSAASRSSPPTSSSGIQDLGGAGLSCATSELACNGDGGMTVWLDRVPLRDSSLRPEEILMSESQERMCAVVEPAKLDDVPGDLRAVGCPGHRHRRGRRQRPAHGAVARRDDRRRPAAHRRARGPGLRAAVRAAGLAGRLAGRRTPMRCRDRRLLTSCARRCCGWSPRRTSRRSRG